MRRLAAVLVPLLAAVALAQGPPILRRGGSPGSPAVKPAGIEGTVVNLMTGVPIRRAAVHLSPEDGSFEGIMSAITDSDGKFVLNNVAPDRYNLTVEHSSFLPYPYRRSSAYIRSTQFYTLAPGQQIKDVVVRMTPGAVVRGLVTDEYGDPVARAQVQAVRADGSSRLQEVMESLQALQTGGGATDDQGEFRLFGIPPGRYYLKVTSGLDPLRFAARMTAEEESAYVETYYPAAASRDAASVIELQGGEELSLNIAYQRRPVYPVTGVLRHGAGVPVEAGSVMAMQSMVPAKHASVREGTFELRLPAGRYTLMGVAHGESFQAGQVPQNVRMQVVVPEGELRDVELVINGANQTPVSVSGHIRPDEGTLPAGPQLFLRLQPQNLLAAGSDEDFDFVGMAQMSSGHAEAKPDGTFEMKDVMPGTYELMINASGKGLEDWYTKAVLVGGRDVQNAGIEVSGQHLQMDVVVSSRGGAVEGVVRNGESPAANALVVLVPDAPRARRQALYQPTLTDQTGKFLVRGLEPGRYTAYAWDDIEDDAWLQPESMKQYQENGVSVTVQAGEKQQLQVPLISNLQAVR